MEQFEHECRTGASIRARGAVLASGLVVFLATSTGAGFSCCDERVELLLFLELPRLVGFSWASS